MNGWTAKQVTQPNITKKQFIQRSRALSGHGLHSLFHKDPPARLYHYTTQQGLVGMIETTTFFATEVKFLNDSDEFIYAIKRAKEAIHKTANASQAPGISAFGHECIDLLDASQKQFYIFSLTEVADSLNQWRSYTTKGPGYALGFDSSRIRHICMHFGLGFGKCIYSHDEADSLIMQVAEHFTKDFTQYFPYFGKGEVNQDLTGARARQFVENFYNFAALIKNPAFMEEQEWRIIAPREQLEEQGQEFAFRCGPHSLVPYAKIKWGRVEFLTALKQIVIKPSPHKELAANALRQLMKAEHRRAEFPITETDIFEITPSTVPYREST